MNFWDILLDVSLFLLYVGVLFKGYQYLARHLDKRKALKEECVQLKERVKFLEGECASLKRRNTFLEERATQLMMGNSTHQWR